MNITIKKRLGILLTMLLSLLSSAFVSCSKAESDIVDSKSNSVYYSCPNDNHPHLIDLGLPSGTKWACCNVGASWPGDNGGYFAWGETEAKKNYNSSSYLDGKGATYNIGSNISGTNYDVAHVKWGGSWVMPDITQWKELSTFCTEEWTTLNGVKGCFFYGAKGSKIFLPAAGVYSIYDVLIGESSNGNYWSSTLYESYPKEALSFYFNKSGISSSAHDDRIHGLSIRPVVKN